MNRPLQMEEGMVDMLIGLFLISLMIVPFVLLVALFVGLALLGDEIENDFRVSKAIVNTFVEICRLVGLELEKPWEWVKATDAAVDLRKSIYLRELKRGIPQDGYAGEWEMIDFVSQTGIPSARKLRTQVRKDIREVKRDIRRARKRGADEALIERSVEALRELRAVERRCTRVIESSLDWLDLSEGPFRESKYHEVDFSEIITDYELIVAFVQETSDTHVTAPAIRDIISKGLADAKVQAEVNGASDVDQALERVRAKAASRTTDRSADDADTERRARAARARKAHR